MLESVTFKNGRICVKVDDAQSSFQIRIQNGRMTINDTGKSSQVQTLAHVNPGQHARENLETTVRKTYRGQGVKFGRHPRRESGLAAPCSTAHGGRAAHLLETRKGVLARTAGPR